MTFHAHSGRFELEPLPSGTTQPAMLLGAATCHATCRYLPCSWEAVTPSMTFHDPS